MDEGPLDHLLELLDRFLHAPDVGEREARIDPEFLQLLLHIGLGGLVLVVLLQAFDLLPFLELTFVFFQGLLHFGFLLIFCVRIFQYFGRDNGRGLLVGRFDARKHVIHGISCFMMDELLPRCKAVALVPLIPLLVDGVDGVVALTAQMARFPGRLGFPFLDRRHAGGGPL